MCESHHSIDFNIFGQVCGFVKGENISAFGFQDLLPNKFTLKVKICLLHYGIKAIFI